MKHAPSNRKLQTTPADGGANIIRSPESGSVVDAAISSPEVRAVVEQPVADDSPLPAGSDVRSHKYDTPRLNITINQIGCLELAYGKDRFAIPADDVKPLTSFLDATALLWIKSA